MISKEQLVQQLLTLSSEAAGSGDFESAVWATIEAGKVLGYIAD